MKISEKKKRSIEAILAIAPALRALVAKAFYERQAGDPMYRGVIQNYALEYQRFLALKVLYPDRLIRPARGVDKVWHSHILDTRRYQADCQAIFHEYLHHDPGVTDASQDAATAELYRQTFAPDVRRKPDSVLAPLLLLPGERGGVYGNGGGVNCG